MRLRIALAGILASAAAPATAAALPAVVVAAFDYTDHSGEVRNQKAFHAAHIAALQADIIHTFEQSGQATAAALRCAAPPCSVQNMAAGDMTRDAQAQHATFLVFGGVEKMSTLIQWGQVEVVNADTGKSILSRMVTFRGDDDDAWRHAADYISRMVLNAIR